MPRERKWTPKSRERFIDNRRMWLRFGAFHQQLVMYEDPNAEPGERTMSFMMVQGGRNMTISMEMLTEPELDLMKDFLTRIIERVRPEVQLRDRIAKEALENGDTSYTRNYRAVPELVDLTRPLGEYDPSIQVGPDGIPRGPGNERNDGSSRRTGSQISEQVSPETVAKDDGPQVNSTPNLPPIPPSRQPTL